MKSNEKVIILKGIVIFFAIVMIFSLLIYSIIVNSTSTNIESSSPLPTDLQPSNGIEQTQWFSGGTLHRAKMREWSRASYKNKLATAADFVMGLLEADGVDLRTVDIENNIKPMAVNLVKGLDNANKDGIANSFDVVEVAATTWVIMKKEYSKPY